MLARVGISDAASRFGQRLMDFQNTRFKLAELATKLEVTRTFVDRCLLAQLAGGMSSPLSTMAGLLAAPLRDLGYGLAQLKEQREGAEAA